MLCYQSRDNEKFNIHDHNDNKVNIVRNGQSNNYNKQNGQSQFLGNKRNFDFYLNKSKNMANGVTETKLMQMIKNEGSDDIVPKKLEFKLSHVLHGENTVKSAEVTTESDKEFYHDGMINSLMYWKKPSSIGSGLNNLGNTCFLNSVLQSLLYTPALRNYLAYSLHMKQCRVKGICFLCEMGKLVSFTSSSKGSVTPRNIIQNLNQIAKSLRIGRQEDAHEFLLYLLDALERSAKQYKISSSLNFISKSATSDLEDNLIQKLFGGKLISSVTCLKCRKTFNKIDNCLDVSLHIYNSENIERCFDNFCKPESLNGNNKFFCENCKSKNDAIKKFSFGKFPRVLIIHLKRFDNFQRKIKKFVKYENYLNLTKFVNTQSDKNDKNDKNDKKEEYIYKLYSVLIHEGFSINGGHYYCDVKNSNDMWYTMNDSCVDRTTEKNVMQQAPYLLFYERVIDVKKEKEDLKKDCREEKTMMNGDAEMHKHENSLNTNSNKENEKKLIHITENTRKENINKENTNTIIKNSVTSIEKININNLEKKSEIPEKNQNATQPEPEPEHITDYFNMKIPFKFTSKKRQKLKNLLKLTKSNSINHTFLDKIIKLTPSIDNDSVETFSESSPDEVKTKPKVTSSRSPPFEKPNVSKGITNTSSSISDFQKFQAPSIIYNRNLTHLYGSDKIELWDTEDDSDLLKEQIRFIKSVDDFKESKILEKDEYDVDYDTGKLKKIKLKKEKFNNGMNVFQRVHDNIGK